MFRSNEIWWNQNQQNILLAKKKQWGVVRKSWTGDRQHTTNRSEFGIVSCGRRGFGAAVFPSFDAVGGDATGGDERNGRKHRTRGDIVDADDDDTVEGFGYTG
jgi:hypothetical protein